MSMEKAFILVQHWQFET